MEYPPLNAIEIWNLGFFTAWQLPETFENEENAGSCYSYDDSARDW
jgi:hypothetical protein